MATGLYVTPGGVVMVAYGGRKIAIPCAQYKANGYKRRVGPGNFTPSLSVG